MSGKIHPVIEGLGGLTANTIARVVFSPIRKQNRAESAQLDEGSKKACNTVETISLS